MAVVTLRWLVAVSAWLPAVSAGLEREHPNLWAPIETPGPKPEAEFNLGPAVPVVTARPAVRAVLQKRNANTCGYINGDTNNGFSCSFTSAVCLYNSIASAVGCCLPENCNIYTACLPYSSSAATATLDMDRTRYCSDPAMPFCAPLSFTDPIFKGYTIPSCDSVTSPHFISYSSSASTTKTTSRSSLALTSVESSASSTSSSSSSSGQSQSQSQAPAETSSNAAAPTPESSSSTPIGPIVGGVVGGVALIALIALGAFFLIRKKKKDTPSPAPGPPAAPGFAPPPVNPAYPNQMQSPGSDMSSTPGGAAGFYDPRYSMVKPPMATQVDPMQPPTSPQFTVSPSQSPPPLYNPAMQPMGPPPHQQYGNTPPPHQQYGNTPPPHQQYGNTPPPHVQQNAPYGYQPQANHHVAELPTQRGDGQVYEAP